MSALFRRLWLAVFLFAAFLASACSEDPVAEPYDDNEIRVLVYRALYEQLSLDTLGCAAMAVSRGDSLPAGMLWPTAFTPHSTSLTDRLGTFIPLRIVDIGGVSLVIDPDGREVYRTVDAHEKAVACFTNEIQRFDGTHLGVKCGVRMHPQYHEILTVCDVAHENGAWHVSAVDIYYRQTTGW